MPDIRIDTIDENGKMHTKHYNTEKSELLCNTPKGKLYLKRWRGYEFYLYHPQGAKTNREKITSLVWDDAKDLVYTYGSRDTYNKYFFALNNSGNIHFHLNKEYTIRVRRNALKKNMGATQFIKWLIDHYDRHFYPQRKRIPKS